MDKNDSKSFLSREVFEIEFKSNFKGLCFFAFQYVKDMDAAKEVVQESFIALWEKRDNIDLSRSVKSYLSTSVRNKCLNYLRDNQKFNKDLLDMEDLDSGLDNMHHDQLVENELREKIDTAIEKLPVKCKEVFLLNRMKQMKYQQIADKLGISVKTVEAQMSKALKHMRTELSDYITALLIIINFLNFM